MIHIEFTISPNELLLVSSFLVNRKKVFLLSLINIRVKHVLFMYELNGSGQIRTIHFRHRTTLSNL